MKPTRPPVRWHGGKWRLAPWIIGHFPSHMTYVEPFGGGASVLLRKQRAALEVYNDLDGEIVNMFRVLRDRGADLARVIELTPFAREEFDDCGCLDTPTEMPPPVPLPASVWTLLAALVGLGYLKWRTR